MSEAYKRAAAKLEAEKKADAARRKKAAKAVKKVKSQPRPAAKNPAKSGRSALSTLAGKVRKEMAKYRAKKQPSKNPANTRTKQVKSAVGSALTSKELDRFRRKK